MSAELIEAIERALWRLDGSRLAAVALMTGMDLDELRALGGLGDES